VGLTGDGLITQTPGLLLAILTADCLPVILVDSKRRAVESPCGLAGDVKRIVEKGVGEMRRWLVLARAISGRHRPRRSWLLLHRWPRVRTQFESQFEYGSKLFREVEESDPVREKYLCCS